MRGATVEVKCAWCKQPFIARVADRKRGLGKFCSKSCKASRQEKQSGQHAAYQEMQEYRGHPYEGGEFANAHLFSNEEHNCNKDL